MPFKKSVRKSLNKKMTKIPIIYPSGSLPIRPGPLRIRLARLGCRNNPIFKVHVIESSRRRDGRSIEVLGQYEPIPDRHDGMKHCQLNFERIKYWLSQGAEPSDRVSWLLGKAGLLPSIPRGKSITMKPNVTELQLEETQ